MDNKVYHRYRHIIDRCYNTNNKSYKRYGGRGIQVCKEWLDDYQSFETWALSHGFYENESIDRIDNDGNYEPDNYRFVSLAENNQNRSTSKFYTIDGQIKNLQQWCNEYSISRGTVNTRLEHGWSIEDALSSPIKSAERDRTSLLGKRFGRLVVLEYAGDDHIGSDNNSAWVCKCDCGKTAIVSDGKLKSGHTKSCGCLVSEKAKQRMLTDNPMKNDRT